MHKRIYTRTWAVAFYASQSNINTMNKSFLRRYLCRIAKIKNGVIGMQIKCTVIKIYIALCIAFFASHQAKSFESVKPKGFVQNAYVKLNSFMLQYLCEHSSDQSVPGKQIDFLHYKIRDYTTNPEFNLTEDQAKQRLIESYQKEIKKERALLAQYTLRSAIKYPYFWGLIWGQANAIFFHPNFKDQPFSRQAYWVAGSYAVAVVGTITFRQFILKPIAEFNCAQRIACCKQKIKEIEGYVYDSNKYTSTE